NRVMTKQDYLRRQGTFPAPVIRLRGDAALLGQDGVRSAQPCRPGARRLRRNPTDPDASACVLSRRNREPAGRGRDVLLLYALSDADPGRIRLLAAQPRSLPPVHRGALADGFPLVRDLSVLAFGPALVSVPGRTGRELAGRAQDPQ